MTLVHILLCKAHVTVWLDKSNNSIGIKLYLYSLSCRIATGSKPWGFCTGVTRFCFCCIWSIEDPCWPGGWGVTELPAIGRAGTTEAWGGPGDGRPLVAGVRCFWAFPWPSPPWTADTEYCYYYWMKIVKKKVKIDMFPSIHSIFLFSKLTDPDDKEFMWKLQSQYSYTVFLFNL